MKLEVYYQVEQLNHNCNISDHGKEYFNRKLIIG